MADHGIDIASLERLLVAAQYDEVVRLCDGVGPDVELPRKFWFCKARALEGLGRTRQAVECYRLEMASVARVPPNLLAHVGSLLMDVGQYSEALVCLRQSCEMEQTVDALVLLASAFSHLGQGAKAVETIRHALEVDPSSDEAWHNLGAYLLDECPADAEQAFRQTLEIDSDRPDSYGGMAKASANQGRYEEAIHAAREGLVRDARCGFCHFVLGEAMEALGRTQCAEAAFARAYRCDGYDRVEALMALSRLSERSGQLANAKLWLDRGVRGWPDDARVRAKMDAFVGRHHPGATGGMVE